MAGQSFGFRYNGQPIAEKIENNAAHAEHDFFVYVMGPFTAFDAEHAYDDADQLKCPFIEDPLFEPDKHVINGEAKYEEALSELCHDIRSRIKVRPFIATDIDIPTKTDVRDKGLSEPGMSVIEQSIAFAAVSHAVIFIYSIAGLNAGVGAEAGAILEGFNLRMNDARVPKKPRERLRIFRGPDFSSASIGEIPDAYGVDCLDFSSSEELLDQIHSYLVGIERSGKGDKLPIFTQY